MGSAVGGALGAIGSIAGGIAGREAGRGDLGEARNAQNIANQILQELEKAPDISKPLILEKYRQAGVLTPQMEQAISAGPSAVAKIGQDQQSIDAQRQALRQMQERSTKGLTEGDRAALEQARLATQGDVESKRQQILQQMQARGLGGSGAELAAQLQASQSGANRESAAANQVAQQAAQQALQATALSGQLGGQLGQQQFSQALQKASAADEMNRFNIGNQLSQQARNVGAANQAQASNLGNLQGIQNANVGQQNQELQNQLQRQMQQYNSNLNRAQLQSGGYQNMGNQLQQSGQQASQGAFNTFAGLGQSLGGLAGAFGGGAKAVPTGTGDSQISASELAERQRMRGFAEGGPVLDYKHGGEVPGIAPYHGDNPKNDIVHAMVSPGEIVVPKSMAESKFGKNLLKLIDAHHQLKKHLNGQE